MLDAFGVRTVEAVDAFIDRYLRSGIAALTLFARTARQGPHGPEGLDYANVWLDKDCLVSPDGALHFADLEGLDWTAAAAGWTVEDRVREQFDRNAYELFYGLHALLRESERIRGTRLTQPQRRRDAMLRLELALAADPFVGVEVGEDGLDLVVRTGLDSAGVTRIRGIDR